MSDVCYVIRGSAEESLRASVPEHTFEELLKAKTPAQMARILNRSEQEIAASEVSVAERGPREYLDCDEMATLMAWALQVHGIAYEDVLGHSDEGSSHAWVRVKGRNYDPTKQGYHNHEMVDDEPESVISRWKPGDPFQE